jgi:hypothetical protein
MNVLFSSALPQKNARVLRLMLYPGEVHTARPPVQTMRVVSGTAYVSHNGCDAFVAAGQSLRVAGGDAALISALRGQMLVVELR